MKELLDALLAHKVSTEVLFLKLLAAHWSGAVLLYPILNRLFFEAVTTGKVERVFHDFSSEGTGKSLPIPLSVLGGYTRIALL